MKRSRKYLEFHILVLLLLCERQIQLRSTNAEYFKNKFSIAMINKLFKLPESLIKCMRQKFRKSIINY